MKSMTVVVTRYAESDEIAFSCLNSLKRQTIPIHVLFLDQQDSGEVKQFTDKNDGSNVDIDYLIIPAKSLSYARNYGLEKAQTRYVAFCDVDCILDNRWAEFIEAAFQSTNAAIVGTKILPVWQAEPSWYMKTKYLREFYSFLDLEEGIFTVTKVVGASFALDKSKMKIDHYFDENLGRQNGCLLCGEDTDLCNRVRISGGEIFYTSYAIANHQIQKERISFVWLQKRAYYGGLSRAVRGGRIEPFSKKVSLVDKLGIILFIPAYFAGRLHGLCLRRSNN